MREEIRAYQNAVSGVVARYDGFVAKYMGDGVLAYFGYPRAHEDDAERAVAGRAGNRSGGDGPGDPWNGAARRPHRHRHRACRGRPVLGSQTGLNGACGKLYPARMRTRGYGFATGVGRLGGIAAGPLGGFLLAKGLPPTYVFLSACVFAAMAAIATAFLALPGRQPIRMAAMEVAL